MVSKRGTVCLGHSVQLSCSEKNVLFSIPIYDIHDVLRLCTCTNLLPPTCILDIINITRLTMDWSGSKQSVSRLNRVRAKQSVQTDGGLAEHYPHPLQLYLQPPTHDVSLQEFEEVATERLQCTLLTNCASLRKPGKINFQISRK